ncbi:SDR family NAD(P)-dependent oxidoreductase [Methylobacterium phyllosphaerae]
MAIKIYGDPGSGSRRRVTSAAAAMGVDIEIVDIDLFKGESHTPEFLEMNPHGLSPVMVDGDFVLYESAAINLYLAEKAGSDLAGRTARERFEILQWMFWSGEQWRGFATLTFDEVLAKRFMGQPADDTIVKLAADKIRAAAAVLDAHLAKHDYMVGDRLTLADFDVAGPFSPERADEDPAERVPEPGRLATAAAGHGAGLGRDEARGRCPHRRCLGGGGHRALKLGVRVDQGDGRQVEAKHGRVDVLFVNVGGGRLEPFEQVTKEDFDHTFDTTAKGTFFTVRKLLPLVPEGRSIPSIRRSPAPRARRTSAC